MKRYISHLGIIFICLGVFLLAAGYFARLTAHNWVGLLALLLIIGGSIFHFYIIKRESRY